MGESSEDLLTRIHEASREFTERTGRICRDIDLTPDQYDVLKKSERLLFERINDGWSYVFGMRVTLHPGTDFVLLGERGQSVR